MPAYYNEFEPFAAQWLRNLIDAGHLPPGDVDQRSILDVHPEDLAPYEQCHFFAGIGVWPYALRSIGWPDARGIWTGSCPCQPFSAAGRQLGFDDERHLWPAWFHLIEQRRPSIIVGEQVASALPWLDLVSNDLEAAGYAFGAVDLCAAGFPMEDWKESPAHEWLLRALYDCPDPMVAAELLDFAGWASGNLGAHDGDHIRQRLYFVGLADRERARWERGSDSSEPPSQDASEWRESATDAKRGGVPSRMADGEDGNGRSGERGTETRARQDWERGRGFTGGGPDSGLADGSAGGRGEFRHGGAGDESRRFDAQPNGPAAEAGGIGGPHAPKRHRNHADWLYCRDGKWRPVGSGTFPLANAPAARVGRLRAYGNALDGETVKAFLASVRECIP